MRGRGLSRFGTHWSERSDGVRMIPGWIYTGWKSARAPLIAALMG